MKKQISKVPVGRMMHKVRAPRFERGNSGRRKMTTARRFKRSR